LRALLDWSYELLTERERALVRRAAIFNGGWTLDAAEQVCVVGSRDASEVVDTLSELADKSLVIVQSSASGVRYRLLAATHEYALEKLQTSGEREAIARRHAHWMGKFAEQCEFAGWNAPIGHLAPAARRRDQQCTHGAALGARTRGTIRRSRV
jgi:predicted ATPase